MKSNGNKIVAIAIAACLTFSAGVQAQDYYVSGSWGINYQDDSRNNGVFNSQFVTGQVTGVSPAQTIPAGTGVFFDTDFDSGDFFSLALGAHLATLRVEFEYRNSENDIDSHRGVFVGGMNLSDVDAGVLVTGNTVDLGVTVGELVAAGRGQYEVSSLMINAYYDFELASPFRPYLGLGIGNADTEAVFRPSGANILNGSDDGFAFQVMAGVAYEIADNLEVFLNYRHFAAEDFSVDASLLPASLVPASFELENQSSAVDVGLRFSF